MHKFLVPAATAAVILVAPAMPRGQEFRSQPGVPKLLVVLAVDQMRGDYIDKYQHQWSAGLKRLVSQGAWFRQADYPYFNTVTCAGHASLSTGTSPSVHGMVLNSWWDRDAGKSVNCTDDPKERAISYNRPVATVGQSAWRLMAPTLPDELRLQRFPAPRVVSVSLKARSAIGLAGRRPDVVTWMDDSGDWVTSTAFAKAPVPFIADYVRSHPMADDLGRAWDRLAPLDRYVGDNAPIGRRKPAIGAMDFPHTVRRKGDPIDGAFVDAWEASPYSDVYVAGLARAAIDAMKLGRGPGTDYLGISFSALDKVGHDFGPDSHEVQDILMRLDRVLAELLAALDRDVGAGNYVVALSADHGVAPVPERAAALGFDAGRISASAVAAAIEQAIARELGPGKYVARVLYTDVYFLPGVYERLTEHPGAMSAALDAMRHTAGVWRVYRKEELLGGGHSGDPASRSAAHSYFEGRSGDILMLPRAHWIMSESTTTHGSGHQYDTRVPVVLFGRGIKPGQYLQPASPLDIAPTLAFLSSVTLSDPVGRVLVEALEGASAVNGTPSAGGSRQ